MACLPDLGRPGLAVPSYSLRGGGVAYVSRLLRMALSDASGRQPWSLELSRSVTQSVSPLRALRFGIELGLGSLGRQFDWIIFSHAGISEAQGGIPRTLRRPYAVQLHGTEAWEGELPYTVREATLRLAPSRFTAERTLAAHPDLGQVVVCPHGLMPDRTETTEVRDQALLDSVGPKTAVIVGRLWSSERRKGHDQLIDCWPAVLDAVPGAELLIIGEGDDLPRLKLKVGEAGISGAIRFCGFVSPATLEDLFRRVAILAMPSRQEGFGITYLEAMKAGVPCIGATDDGASEPIVHGQTGLLVEQSDRRALAAAIIALLQNEEFRRQLGHAGRQRYLREFTFDRYRERLIGVLHRAIAPVLGNRIAAGRSAPRFG